VEEALPEVLWLIEEPDPVKTGIGVPLYWTAEKAAEMGFRVMLAGQGADELFGGYRRYLNDYLKNCEEELQETMFRDVARLYETNLERDAKICIFNNIELRLPFATYKMAEFSTRLPLNLKIKSPKDTLRKIVLRKVAENLGLPSFIAKKPKRAIQYATGVNKAIKKLAKEKGLSTREYLQNIFQRMVEGFMQ
jgi:asparagine synthase (glutamine-hydrolysing)